MADTDVLPQRGVPALALVDSTGIATNGSQTVAQLAARGMRAVCAVDATGVSVSGATVAQLASVGIRAFCPVDENGVSQAGPNADALRRAGIRPMVLLGNTGIALTGSATMLTLAQRGLQYFCPVDEAGNATTMGAVILISNTTIFDIAAVGSNVGVLSVVGGTGTYTFTLTNNAGGRFVLAGTNGVNLNTASAVTVGTYAVTVSATNGGTPITRTINISVVVYVPARLTASVGIFPYNGEDMVPVTGYMVTAAVGTFPFAGQNATLTPPVGTFAIWNNADKGTGIVLSGSPLTTVSFPSIGGSAIVRATVSKTAGKFYFEFVATSFINFTTMGIANAAHALDGEFLGGGANSVSWMGSGTVFINSGILATWASWGQSDNISIAVDLTAKKIWGRKNGGNWNNDVIANQDPATGTGGASISAVTGTTFFPAAFDNNPGGTIVANFGASAYTFTPPTGFLNWQ